MTILTASMPQVDKNRATLIKFLRSDPAQCREEEIAKAIASGGGDEVSELNLRAFSSRFGSVVEQCGGMDL